MVDEKLKYWVFLEKLRRSGITNMFGAVPYIVSAYGVTEKEAFDILMDWMKNYCGSDYKANV